MQGQVGPCGLVAVERAIVEVVEVSRAVGEGSWSERVSKMTFRRQTGPVPTVGRRSACDGRVELGPLMCWRRSARTASSAAGTKVLWLKEVELALDRRP